MTYQEFTTLPEYQTGHWQDKMPVKTGDVTWFNANPPPPIGAKVRATINRLGTAKVIGYFVEEGYLGLLVTLDNPPDWHVKQNRRNIKAHLFGPEFEPVEGSGQ